MWDHSLVELFQRGGFAMWPLLFFSVLGLALILDRLLALFAQRGRFQGFVRRYRPLLQGRRYDEARKRLARERMPAARVVEAFLDNLAVEPVLRRQILEQRASERISVLESRLGWLSVIASLAPMIGLLGTVTGLVGAFHAIELKGGAVHPGDLAGGIWEALLTTVYGLVVAIPCAFFYNMIEQRIATITLQMDWMIAHLHEWLGTAEPGAA